MTILNADYIITMPNQSKWKLPVRVIAESRAQHYLGAFPSMTQAMDDTRELFESDDYEIEDWAKNNMNWSDVREHAQMVEEGDIDYEEGWANGEVEIDPEDRDGC